MTTSNVLRVVAIALTALTLVGQRDAAADKTNVEEFYGTGFRAVSGVVAVNETLSDCGDADASSNVILQTTTGSVTYTGILEGTGQLLTKTLINRCVPSQPHNTFRVLDSFESLTVDGRTGGAWSRSSATGALRILCGTGELKGVHAEGTLTTSIGPGVDVRAMQVWVHFGHNHDVGFDFLCEALDGN